MSFIKVRSGIGKEKKTWDQNCDLDMSTLAMTAMKYDEDAEKKQVRINEVGQNSAVEPA